MRFGVLVEVRPRAGIADPEGATVEAALPALGLGGVSKVRVGKAIRFEVEAGDLVAARATAEQVAHRLLANPVIEDAECTLHPVDGT